MLFLIRVLGFVLVSAGFVTFVMDGARAIANDVWGFTLIGDLANAFFPQKMALVEVFLIQNVHALAWNPVMTSVLAAPASLTAIGIGLLLIWAGQGRKESIGFAIRG